MRVIGKKNTKPELVVRQILHGMGHRFRLHRHNLPATPDIDLPRHRLAIQVHGCFCIAIRANAWRSSLVRALTTGIRSSLELSNETNKHLSALKALGARAAVVWECEIGDRVSLQVRLEALI